MIETGMGISPVEEDSETELEPNASVSPEWVSRLSSARKAWEKSTWVRPYQQAFLRRLEESAHALFHKGSSLAAERLAAQALGTWSRWSTRQTADAKKPPPPLSRARVAIWKEKADSARSACNANDRLLLPEEKTALLAEFQRMETEVGGNAALPQAEARLARLRRELEERLMRRALTLRRQGLSRRRNPGEVQAAMSDPNSTSEPVGPYNSRRSIQEIFTRFEELDPLWSGELLSLYEKLARTRKLFEGMAGQTR